MRKMTLKADSLSASVPQNPRLVLIDGAEGPYLWIGNEAGFVGIARNSAATRKFLRKALERMERAK
jgi:hypothetical protein